MIHMPGHTLYQAAVVIKEEGVDVHQRQHASTGWQTWLHECNPDLWLTALEGLRKLDEDMLRPRPRGLLCRSRTTWTEQGDVSSSSGRTTCKERLTGG